MILFVGLGNPGKEYENTPHNAGFRAMDKLQHSLGYSSAYNVLDWDFDKYSQGLVSIGKSDNEVKFALAKPLTFMNRSGRTVSELIHRYKLDADNQLVVFYDDLDIKLGDVKITRGKSPKGHNGLASIFQSIKKHNFLSVRVGIENRENKNIPGEDYVLRDYSDEELAILDKSISEAIKKVRLLLEI